MAKQEHQSQLAAKFGARFSKAVADTRDKPIDSGIQRLPAGINNGIAKLQSMTFGVYKDGDSKGEEFFRAAAVVMAPEVHAGVRCVELETSLMIPLCDVPEKGKRKAQSFEENTFKFQNLFKLLSNGELVCPLWPDKDPTGQKTLTWYQSAIKLLLAPRKPDGTSNAIYITFSTRGWTPPATIEQPKPKEMVFETWHSVATKEQIATIGKHDPAAGVQERSTPPQPHPMSAPPTPPSANGPAVVPRVPVMAGPATSLPAAAEPEEEDTETTDDLDEEVTSLIAVAMDDPSGETEDGAAASARLEELAWANGWTKQQTTNAADWEEVGDMALNPPPVKESEEFVPNVGSLWLYAKRGADGLPLKNKQGQPFAPQEVEVTTVNVKDKTCTVKTTKDSKDVLDMRTKAPAVVKWEWLQSLTC